MKISKITLNYFPIKHPLRLFLLKLVVSKTYRWLYILALVTNIFFILQLDYEKLVTKYESLYRLTKQNTIVFILIFYIVFFSVDKLIKAVVYGFVITEHSINSNAIDILDNIVLIISVIWMKKLPSIGVFRIFMLVKELAVIFKPVKLRTIAIVTNKSFNSIMVLSISFAIMLFGLASVFHLNYVKFI